MERIDGSMQAVNEAILNSGDLAPVLLQVVFGPHQIAAEKAYGSQVRCQHPRIGQASAASGGQRVPPDN